MKLIVVTLLAMLAFGPSALAAPTSGDAPDWYFPQWLADVAAYLTDTRTRFGSHLIDPAYTWPEAPCMPLGQRHGNDYKRVPEVK